MDKFDHVVVGAGIVGSAVAHEVLSKNPKLKVAVVEKEASAALHQTGRNSGVIHSGIYYKQNSLKSKLCLEGIGLLERFCSQNHIPFLRNGKLIIATSDSEEVQLRKLASNADKAEIPYTHYDQRSLRAAHPYLNGVSAIKVESTGTIDYKSVCDSLLGKARENGLEVFFGQKVENFEEAASEIIITTTSKQISARHAIFCGGLHSDNLVRDLPSTEGFHICPIKGRYFNLRDDAIPKSLEEHVYPVPNPKYPFLGVHLTKTLKGGFHVGPNAVLALSKEDYEGKAFELFETTRNLSRAGTIRFIANNFSEALSEARVFLSKSAFLKKVQKLMPDVRAEDLIPAPCGIRAQAMNNRGDLYDDFLFRQTERRFHVLNAPSPAATSSLAIAKHIVSRVCDAIG